MSDDTHAKYSPSQLPRIIGCPGSTTVQEEEESSEYANDGTDCHTMVSDHLVKGQFQFNPKHALFQGFDEEKQLEYEEPIQDCLDYASTIIGQYKKCTVLIEQHVSLIGFCELFKTPSLEDVAGTADLIIMVPSERIIHDIDWKFGVGEVFPDSEQLKGYGVGTLSNPFLAGRYDEVHLHIGQPRVYSGNPFKVHKTTPNELLDWVGSDLVPALIECEGPNPSFHPSDKACQWCSAKQTCKFRNNMANETAMEVFKNHAILPNVTTIKDLADFLIRARVLSSYIKDIEGHLVKTLKSGVLVDGLKMVEGRAQRYWKDEKEVFKWATENVPEAEIFDTKLLSPNKMEKLIKRKIASTDEFKELYGKTTPKHTMVNDSDPREAIVYQTASEIFADFAEED